MAKVNVMLPQNSTTLFKSVSLFIYYAFDLIFIRPLIRIYVFKISHTPIWYAWHKRLQNVDVTTTRFGTMFDIISLSFSTENTHGPTGHERHVTSVTNVFSFRQHQRNNIGIFDTLKLRKGGVLLLKDIHTFPFLMDRNGNEKVFCDKFIMLI